MYRVAEGHTHERRKRQMDTVRIVCVVIAVLLLGLIVLRRKKSAE